MRVFLNHDLLSILIKNPLHMRMNSQILFFIYGRVMQIDFSTNLLAFLVYSSYNSSQLDLILISIHGGIIGLNSIFFNTTRPNTPWMTSTPQQGIMVSNHRSSTVNLSSKICIVIIFFL